MIALKGFMMMARNTNCRCNETITYERYILCCAERTDDVMVGTNNGGNSSRINQDVSNFKMDLFRSPSVGAMNKSGMCQKRKFRTKLATEVNSY